MHSLRLGVLTGGGDAPGLNAFLRFLVRALEPGDELIGFEDAFLGLMEDRFVPLTRQNTRGLHRMGGTILGSTSSGNPFTIGGRDRTAEIAANYAKHALDALIAVGGDGTLEIAARLAERYGLRILGIPKTIDGDVSGTSATLGFATAVSVAVEALDRLEATASSHHRMLALEVMGRSCGRLALHAAVATGADGVLLAERPYSMSRVLDLVTNLRAQARFSVLVVSEGARPEGGSEHRRAAHVLGGAGPLGGVAEEIAAAVERATGVEARSVVLGHVVRGAAPVAADRILAARFAGAAVAHAHAGTRSALLALRKGDVEPVPFGSAGQTKVLDADDPVVRAAGQVGISFCEPDASAPWSTSPPGPI